MVGVSQGEGIFIFGISIFFAKVVFWRINQRHHSLRTRLGTHHRRQ